MSDKVKISLEAATHQNKKVIFIRFPYNIEIIRRVKKLKGIIWSQSMKSWYIPIYLFKLEEFKNLIGEKGSIYSDGIYKSKKIDKPVKISLPKGYLEKLEQRRYSINTIRIYTHYFRDFQKYFLGRELTEISKDDINMYILKLIKKRSISASQQNQRINAIKFYYEKVLGMEKEYYELLRPKKERKLPDILDKEEVSEMIRVTENLKHKSILAIIYSCGLRRSELIDLRLTDIDSKRMLVKIRNSKGKMDRYVQLAEPVLRLLRKYFIKEKPDEWLFEGIRGDRYSPESVVKLVSKAAYNAGIKKRVTPHTLRHCFATHHLEQGTDLRFIQEWLGHASSKTTERYTHVSKTNFGNFKNPIDDMEINDT